MKDNKKEIELLIRSGYKLIQVVSYEWQRVEAFALEIADNLRWECYIWNCVSGLRETSEKEYVKNDEGNEITDARDVLEFFYSTNKKMILILEDFHPFYNDNNYEMIRFLREISKQKSEKTILLSQPYKQIPKELIKEMALIEISLPKKEELKIVLEQVKREFSNKKIIVEEEKIINSALGLSIMEAELAFKKAVIKNNKLTELEIPIIIQEKENIIKKSGLLEYYHPEENFDSIGGLEELKKWLKKREYSFFEAAKEYGLNVPKGILLIGVPGCGKSLTAKAIGKVWNFPILKFDLGKVFAGIVGESESNIRYALEIAKTISPCILWIDEIEKGFSGIRDSGSSDGGTSSRVFGTFLTWMQEKKEPVFVVATANDISLLPPELLRKGRFDEIFFVDLPSKKERQKIFEIHIKNKKRKTENFDLEKLSESTRGFSGSEIEQLINEALFSAFDNNEEIATKHLLKCVKDFCPLSKTMAETIKNLRVWVNSRARKSSEDKPEDLKIEEEKLVLKQEKSDNPFYSKKESF
jgi:SpoVK/Ycf46/Vps4 family AAA+-type ATPase